MHYKEEQHLLSDKLEYIYIELPKFLEKNPDMDSKLNQWLWLFVGREDMVQMASKENKLVEKVVEDLDVMTAAENERFDAYRRELELWGYRRTEEDTRAEIAKKMKEKGIEIELIVETTGLSKEEVEAL